MHPIEEAAVVESKILFMLWLSHKLVSHSIKAVLTKKERGPTDGLSSSLYIL